MGTLDDLNKELDKRNDTKLDLKTIPTEVLERVKRRLEDDEAAIEEALRAWRKTTPNGSGGEYCNCTTDKYQSGGPYTSTDCWLCGGYTY